MFLSSFTMRWHDMFLLNTFYVYHHFNSVKHKNYKSLHVTQWNGNSQWRNWRWSIRPIATPLPFAPVAEESSVHVRSARDFIDRRAQRIRAIPQPCHGSQHSDRGPSGHHGRKFAWGRRETAERGKVILWWWWWWWLFGPCAPWWQECLDLVQ